MAQWCQIMNILSLYKNLKIIVKNNLLFLSFLSEILN